MENYCAFSKNHACLKWLDYVITRQELEEADIHAFHRNGLYSLRCSHSMSRSVFLRFFVHSGRRFMLCSFMAF